MIATELWVIYALVFGAVLLGFQAIYWVLFKERREKQAINRRLALTAELANPKEVLQILRKERGDDLLAHIPSLQSFKELVVQSGVRLTGTKCFWRPPSRRRCFSFCSDSPRGPVFWRSRLRVRLRSLRSICFCYLPAGAGSPHSASSSPMHWT